MTPADAEHRAAALRRVAHALDVHDAASDKQRAFEPLLTELQHVAWDYNAVGKGSVVVAGDDPDLEEKVARSRAEGRSLLAVAEGGRDVREVAAQAEATFRGLSEKFVLAAELGVLPEGHARAPIDIAPWLELERRIDGPLAQHIEKTLDEIGWDYVFHVTKAAHLPSIARWGVVDSGVVDLLSIVSESELDLREHGDRTKQELLQFRVFCGFWPPFWLFTDSHFGLQDAVILAIDSAAVCMQPGCAFVKDAVRAKSVTTRNILNSRNTEPGGADAWSRCWSDGPRPEPRAEIICGRIHPAHIRGVMFADAETKSKWWPAFQEAFKDAYPSMTESEPSPMGRSIEQGRTSMGFPASYRP